MRLLFEKVKSVFFSVLPIIVIVIFLHLSLTPLPPALVFRFLLGALLIIIGLSIFLFGVDIGVSPLGNHIGSTISKSNRIWIVVITGLILGFFISVAEPDLQILANQVMAVTNGKLGNISILLVVSVGIAALLVIGFIRIFYNIPIHKSLLFLYGIILLLSFFVPAEFLAIAFDASGATTGALAVPFILALGLGVSSMKKNSFSSEEDSFGLVAITSTGAILGVLLMGFITKINGLEGVLPKSSSEPNSYFAPFITNAPKIILEAVVSLLPLLVIFIFFQIIFFKFNKKPVKKILKGFLYTFIGLTLFMIGVNAGFMEVGALIGSELARLENKAFIILFGFIIGVVTILAEPAVHILTDQIELVTSGYVKRVIVLTALSIGVGFAVALAMLRIIVPSIQLWHYLLPGYIICVILSFIVPKLYVGIAFDSGGVASGTMTATFILAFAQGVAESIPNADILKDAFGTIAIVAMTPIITLQILGLIVKINSRNKKKRSNDSNE